MVEENKTNTGGKNISEKYGAPKIDLPLYAGKYDTQVFEEIKERVDRSELEPNFAENAVSVLEMRYLRKREDGKPSETPKGLVSRVASFVAYPEYAYSGDKERAYSTANEFYEMMARKEFMPNSPTLMNAGREMGMLSACFVLPIEDSIDGIFDSIKTTAMIQKAGGGTGYTFDNLRPTGDFIKSSGGTTSGPLSFWRVFAEATNAIQQGAFRRGANMGMMSVWHPDILKFINAKVDGYSFENFNTSVKVTEAWMKDFISHPDSPLIVRNPRTGKQYYIPKKINMGTYTIKDLIPLEDSEKTDLAEVYTSRMLWQNIIENDHLNGDPGLAFIDRMDRDNPTPSIGRIDATNPCGEQPLLPYEACNLGSINLSRMIIENRPDFDKLRGTTRKAVRFLDNVIDMNSFPLEKITEIVSGNRKIGLGVMGWAEMLTALRIKYGSPESIELGKKIMSIIQEEAGKESERLAEERGAFPNFEQSIYAGKKPRRNAALTTIAPSGTICIIADTSAGIEPIFGNAFAHRDAEGNIRERTSQILRRDLENLELDADYVFKQLFEGKSLAEIEGVPPEISNVYITSHEVSIKDQVAMQAAFQENVDSAVSKTINLVNEATVEDVDKAYKEAFLSGSCKGITAYRNGSRDDQPIIFGKLPDSETLKKKVLIGTVDKPLKVPEMMPAVRIRQDTPFGHIHSNIVCDPSNDYRALETFGLLGNAGKEEAATLEGFGRTISLYLRSGGHIESITEQLIGIGSETSRSTRSGQVGSIAMGLGKCFLKFIVARNYFNMKDLLLGRVDYDQFSQEVSDIIRRSDDGEGGLLKLMKGFEQGQDFIEKSGDAAAIRQKRRSSRRKISQQCPECRDGVLIRQEGCMSCSAECGFSRC